MDRLLSLHQLHLLHLSPLQGSRKGQRLLSLSILNRSLAPCMSLLPRLPRYTSGTRTGTNGKALTRQPRLQNTPNNVQCTGLDNPPPNLLTPPHTDVYDTLEGERESVCGVFIEHWGVERRLGFGRTRVGWEKAVNDRWVFRRWWGEAKVL